MQIVIAIFDMTYSTCTPPYNIIVILFKKRKIILTQLHLFALYILYMNGKPHNKGTYNTISFLVGIAALFYYLPNLKIF